ncbi:MAG TPA: DEAD/DEAH box helicase family protein, partial [Bacteroidota bacterium]
MNQFFVDIALPVPIDHPFTYIVPPDLQPLAKPGARAVVPFGRKQLTGVIVGIPSKAPTRGLKPVRDILDATPTFSDEMLALTRWIAEYYITPWGEALKAAAPQGFLVQGKRSVKLLVENLTPLLESTRRSTPKQYAILQALQKHGALPLSRLQRAANVKNVHAVLREMEQKGWVEILEEPGTPAAKPKLERVVRLAERGQSLESGTAGKLTPKQSALIEALTATGNDAVPVQQLLKHANASLSTLKALAKRGVVILSEREVLRTVEYGSSEPPPHITLNDSQQQSLAEITRALESNTYTTFLLHGVTGSGKTQVYIEAIRSALAAGKTAIVLVPEISLTPQIVRRFNAYFGADVAVMHSQMSAGERYDAWRLAQQGKVHIVIG